MAQHSTFSALSSLRDTVQHNCHIADARHAGDYTLCIYLLKMRELYRWEQGENFSSTLGNNQVGKWLRQRESLWDEIETEEYRPLPLGDTPVSPFESEQVNQLLRQHQLVYSGGMGVNNRPHFFLADLQHYEQHGEIELYVAGHEYARDMAAPPAMSLGNTIYIRTESLRRLLWEKLETWRWNKPDNALGRAFACYDMDNNLDVALQQMTDAELDNVIEHERGEIQAGKQLGDKWQTLLYSVPYSKAAIMLRAIRDHLADCLRTLPALLEKNQPAAWHFYFGNLNNMRKDLFPSLQVAYDEWYQYGTLSKMRDIMLQGQQHWYQLCQQVMQIEHATAAKQQKAIEQLIESQRL